jgi:hypothetical protein
VTWRLLSGNQSSKRGTCPSSALARETLPISIIQPGATAPPAFLPAPFRPIPTNSRATEACGHPMLGIRPLRPITNSMASAANKSGDRLLLTGHGALPATRGLKDRALDCEAASNPGATFGGPRSFGRLWYRPRVMSSDRQARPRSHGRACLALRDPDAIAHFAEANTETRRPSKGWRYTDLGTMIILTKQSGRHGSQFFRSYSSHSRRRRLDWTLGPWLRGGSGGTFAGRCR